MTTKATLAETAKKIRQDLKENFPDVKFQVRLRTWLGASSSSGMAR